MIMINENENENYFEENKIKKICKKSGNENIRNYENTKGILSISLTLKTALRKITKFYYFFWKLSGSASLCQ